MKTGPAWALAVCAAVALTMAVGPRAAEPDDEQPDERVEVPPHRFTLKGAATVDSELLAFPRASLLDHFAAHPDVGYAVGLNVAAVIGRRLQLVQTMWLREMQRVIELRHA